jgi:hypothetical protein
VGRKRKYASNAERQAAFRERKQLEERRENESKSRAKQSNKQSPTAYFFEKYTLQQVQSAYAKYKQLCPDNGYDVARRGDYEYDGRSPSELADVVLDPETNIKFFEMSDFIDNIYSWYCVYCEVYNSVFEDKCGKCHRTREPQALGIERLYELFNEDKQGE